MKYVYLLLVITTSLYSCKKSTPTPGDITYPEYHNGKINLLAIESDTFYVNSQVDFYLAADVPANRSIKFVLQPAVQPATSNDWAGAGMNVIP